MAIDEMRHSKWEYRFEPLGEGDLAVEIMVRDIDKASHRRLEPGMSLERRRPRAENRLNTLGEDGWELVTFISKGPVTAVLKRPLAS